MGRAQQLPVPFVGVQVDSLNNDTEDADAKHAAAKKNVDAKKNADDNLMDSLKAKTNINFISEGAENYHSAIRHLLTWGEQKRPYVARMTPYAYVVAELMGAKMDILATYCSKAASKVSEDGSTCPENDYTYHSYFVVNRRDFPGFQSVKRLPNLKDLLDFINNRKPPVNFVYHDKLSTSGYFVPAQFFQGEHIFSGAELTSNPTPISGTALITYVGTHPGEIAAVWDKDKLKYENNLEGHDSVYFIELQTAIPNDLFVCSTWMSDADKESILHAIDGLIINTGDFISWSAIKSAVAVRAKSALEELRRMAVQHSPSVVISLENINHSVPQENMEAIKQGIRESGTEFALPDVSYPGKPDVHDVTWKIMSTHDGAILLRTKIEHVPDLDERTFHISFVNQVDLTKRIANLIHQRMDRIRYVWPNPYDDNPTILRDVDFSVDKGSTIYIQVIDWRDPLLHHFVDSFRSQVKEADAFKFQLQSSDAVYQFDLNPLSNIAYRAILERPPIEEPLFFKLTIGLVVLFLLTGIAAAADLRRRSRLTPAIRSRNELIEERLQSYVQRYHAPFGKRPLADKDVLWCDRQNLEYEITELKIRGEHVKFDVVRSSKNTKSLGLKLSAWGELIGISHRRELSEELFADPSKVGDASRLSDFVRFLVNRNRLSQFIGKIPDFEILDSIVAEFLGVRVTECRGDDTPLLAAKNGVLISRIGDRFLNIVMPEADTRLSLFYYDWSIDESSESYILSHIVELPFSLPVNGRDINKLRVECRVPKTDMILETASENILGAWVLGRIKARNVSVKESSVFLVCRFSLLAVITNSQ
jgi:ABC-type phosphate/phosphonate transport system substrate-binding protein